MIFPAEKFNDYCAAVRITSKEHEQPVPLRLWATQRHFFREVASGLEEDVHSFVVLKGCRQAGITTACVVLGSFWLQTYSGMQGMTVTESQENLVYVRDVMRDLCSSAPAEYRRPVLVDNPVILKWQSGSRMMFAHASRREGVTSSLGRSRGLNFTHNTEVGSWSDDSGYKSLRAAQSKIHPRRLYIDESTASSYGLFYDLWKTAEHAVSQRAIFIGSWLHELYRINPEMQPAIWEAYGQEPPTPEEARRIAEVERRFGVRVPMEHLAWYRLTLAEEMRGDQTMMAQEFGWLPEECFQSFGNKFVSAATLRRLDAQVEAAVPPTYYLLNWGEKFDTYGDETIMPTEDTDAPLVVWEEPQKDAVYVVGAHPAYSSSPEATEHAIEVFRAWPDMLQQVAEFTAPGESPMYEFTWTVLALCSAFATKSPPWLIVDVAGPGNDVLEEKQRIQGYGWGLSTKFREANPRVSDFLGNTRDFLYRRPDSFTRSVSLHWKSHSGLLPWVLHQFRDTLDRGAMMATSESFVDEIKALRQGGAGTDNDSIGAFGLHTGSRVMAAALANHMFLGSAVPELSRKMLPKNEPVNAPKTATDMVIHGFFGRLLERQAKLGRRR